MKRVVLTGDMNLSGLRRVLSDRLKADASWSVEESTFNAWQTDLLNPDSAIYKNPPELLLVLLSPRLLSQGSPLAAQIEATLVTFGKHRVNTKILFSNMISDPLGPQPFYSSIEQQESAARINSLLCSCQKENLWFYILDFAGLAARFGLDKLCDARFESLGRMFLSPYGSGVCADLCARALRAIFTTPKKVLVVDLDNTLWGGVLGEDGVDGILCGGEGPGYSFLRFQNALLQLKANGILLAVCSKNNEAEVVDAFATHPDFALRLNDFAARRINWEPKVENIKSMAQELNLGLDSFVFVDDSSHECESVRQGLPMVQVLQFPTESAEAVRLLFEYPGFDIFRVTDEDRKRSKQYIDEAQRQIAKQNSGSLEEFYLSLEMKATLNFADSRSLARVHQLIHKTNQFNLTSERLDEAAVQQRLQDTNVEIITLTLKDRLGESGLTGLVILRKGPTTWHIENLMMSCRIIGRTVEFAWMRFLASRAAAAGASQLTAHFVSSARNAVAKEFLPQCGFRQTGAVWVLDIAKDLDRLPQDYVAISLGSSK